MAREQEEFVSELISEAAARTPPHDARASPPHVVRWRLVAEPPAEGQLCHIRGEADLIRTNLPYSGGSWADIFIGLTFNAECGVTAWIPADELDVDGGMPDE